MISTNKGLIVGGLIIVALAIYTYAWLNLVVTSALSTLAVLDNPSKVQFPLLPLQHCEKYTTRKTDHLQVVPHTISLVNLQPVEMQYLNGTKDSLKKENLYAFENYIRSFEGGVSHAWISILQNSRKEKQIVIDGGMNTGFYTILTAVMGYEVHAFDLQRDCFDVVQMLLEANGVEKRANLYNMGIGGEVAVIQAGEGCNPGYYINMSESQSATRQHMVAVIPLDLFLDQVRKDREIAILKLDIEGAEIPALKGLVRHLRFCRNIIMEFSSAFSSRFVKKEEVKEQYQRLERAGFVAYKLFSFRIPEDRWRDKDLLLSAGLKNLDEHPVLGTPIVEVGSTMMWKIVDWDRFFEVACPVGCNIWFTRKP